MLSRGDYDGDGAAAESFHHFPFGKIKYNILYYKKIIPDNIKTAAGTTPQQPTDEERFLYFMFPGSLITAVDLIVALAVRIYYIIFGFQASCDGKINYKTVVVRSDGRDCVSAVYGRSEQLLDLYHSLYRVVIGRGGWRNDEGYQAMDILYSR